MSNSNETPKTAAIYVRCSTGKQDTVMQRTDLEAYCQRRGWSVFKVYEDKAVSGKKNSRPALDELMKAARQKRFDVVAVWRFDRFGRSTAHLVNSLNEFQQLGIDFVSLNEALDSSTPTGRVLFTVIAAIAEFERSIIVERVRGGLQAARRNGVVLGRPRKAFDTKKAVQLRQGGASLRQISREMGVSLSTVWRAIGNV